MNVSVSELVAENIQITSDAQIVSYINVISLALLVYDSSLTLSDEIRVIWRQKTNPGAVLYYLSRYVGLINTILNVAFSFVNITGVSSCDVVNIVLNICFLLSFVGTNGLFAARAYALCGSKKYILTIILCFFAADIIPVLLQMIVVPNCNLDPKQFKFLTISSVVQIGVLIVSDTVEFMITTYHAYHAWRIRRDLPFAHSVPNLINILFCQGVLRYCFVLVVTIAQAILEQKARPSIQGVLGPLQQTLSILLLCRFSIDLRSRSTFHTAASRPESKSITLTPRPLSQTNTDRVSAVADYGLENPRGYGPLIQRAVQYIHEELISEFGDMSSRSSSPAMTDYESDIILEDLASPDKVEELTPLPQMDFGDFRWSSRGGQLFNVPV